MSDNPPTVSVIIPTYNRARFIGQAVASSLGQTYDDLEVIVVDDGSTDETPGIIGTFSDLRLRYVRLDKNGGRSRARNKALSLARGRYITFLDSDDYHLPYKTKLQVDYLESKKAVGMVYTAAACVDDDGQSLHYFYRAPLSGRIYNEIAFFKPLTIILPTVMLRREVLDDVGLFDESMERFEDTDLWRRIAKKFTVAAIDEVTCHIRTHAGNRIEALDPRGICHAVDYYVAKVLRDDDVNPLILGAGARRLYELYGDALATVPGAGAKSDELKRKSRLYFEPMVSIVMPVYNGANYLQTAIDSALAQTYRNIEIVVVNDGSNDGGATERIVLSYGDRIRYVSKPNGGCASALNRAVQESKGDYISWLSHDDLYTPDKIEQQIAFLVQQPDPSRCVVYGDYSVFSGPRPPSGLAPYAMPQVRPENFRYFLTTQNILHGCTLLIPKAAFERHGLFDEKIQTVLDFDLWFRLAKTERFIHRPGVVVQSRAHPDQDTNRKRDLHMREADELLARFVEELSPDEVRAGSSCHPVKGYYVIAASLRRRNFLGAAARAVKIAEETTRSAVRWLREAGNSGEPAPEVADAVDTVETAISVAGWFCLQGSLPPAVQYVEVPTQPASAVGASLEERAINSPIARDMVRVAASSPRIKVALRRVVQRLPAPAQARLRQFWRRMSY
jgi:glycosyltransferase involved in cell wall biosynthesis